MRTLFLLLLSTLFGILYAQNIGIGTPIPAAKLEVRGDFRLSNSASNYVNFALPASSQTTNYTLPASAGTNGQFLQTDGTGALSWVSGSNSIDYLLVQEEAPNGATIGSQIIGFNKRLLNTTKKLVGSAISFDSIANTITLIQPGTYHIIASAPCWAPNSNQLLIRNVTTNAVLISGTSQVAATGATAATSTAEGFITISSPTTFKLDHYMNDNGGASGFGQVGIPATGARGVFARCFVEKMATPSLSLSSSSSDYLVAYERQPNNTAAGNAIGGAFTQRNLNRVQTLSGTAISLDSVAHTITLNQAGTYHIRASAPAWQVSRHQLVVRNTVSNAILLTGTTQHSNNTNGTLNTSLLEGVITISGTTTIKLDHFFEGTSTVGTQGMGASSATASGLEGVFALCVVEKMQTTPVSSSPSAWSDYLIVEEQLPASVDVPSVAGFQTRDLNTITASNGSSISCDLVGNTITLLPGTYHIVASGPALNVAEHQMRLINTATSLPIALGQSSHSNNGGPSQTFSNVDCIITVGTNTTFKLEHHVTYTRANGLGTGGGSGTNVFARCFVQKIQ